MNKLLEERFIISAAVIILAALYDFGVTFFHPVLDKELLTVILTALNANGMIIAVQYWLGSSKGSNDKTEMIATLNKP